jgi:hypothetical protein
VGLPFLGWYGPLIGPRSRALQWALVIDFSILTDTGGVPCSQSLSAPS